MLSFGHGGTPWLIFPTSQGRYFEFEDRHMVATVADRIDAGEVQLFCVDSVDSESWYNKRIHPRHRVERHLQYEGYLLHEVVPLMQARSGNSGVATAGCSFGGYHAMNFALRHPDAVSQCLTIAAAFDITQFLNGYYDQDCYFNCPPHFLPGMSDPWYLDRYRRNWYLMATGEHDFCWQNNEQLASIMREKQMNHRIDVWGNGTGHDWPWWTDMVRAYLR